MQPTIARLTWAVAGLALVLLSGCASPLRPNFNSPEAAERILAIERAARAGDQSALPLIVDRLEDEDDGVQFFAMLALEHLAGDRKGLATGQTSAARAAAIGRWRAYVDRGAHKVTINRASRGGGPTPLKAGADGDAGRDGDGDASPGED
jgi:HEAT repeat protein